MSHRILANEVGSKKAAVRTTEHEYTACIDARLGVEACAHRVLTVLYIELATVTRQAVVECIAVAYTSIVRHSLDRFDLDLIGSLNIAHSTSTAAVVDKQGSEAGLAK